MSLESQKVKQKTQTNKKTRNEIVLKELMAENSPNLAEDINLQIHEVS